MQITLYQLIQFILILTFSLILSIQDIKRMTVGLYIEWAAILSGLICHLIFIRQDMWIFILSSLLAGAFYYCVRKITRDKLGMADVWFGFFQGLFLLPKLLPLCFGLECLAVLCLVNKKIGKKAFPFIPYMSFGLISAFIIQLFIE